MIKVYKIKIKDLLQFVSLWNQEYKILTSSHFQMTLKKAKKGYYAKMFDYYGIYNDNILIGFLLLKKEDKILWIKHILIDKNFRKRGFGTLLLKKAEKIAKKKQMNLKTEVVKENNEVIQFFLKNKFKVIIFDKKENQYILEKVYESL